MSGETQNGITSDAETSEKPVREQLKKASLSNASGAGAAAKDDNAQSEEPAAEATDDGQEHDARGRPQKKRSFEDLEDTQTHKEATSSTRQHTRKRSRDSTAEEDELNNGQRKSVERPRDDADIDQEDTSNGHPKPPSTERQRTPEQTGEKRSEAAVEQMTSPKTKRSRLQASSDKSTKVDGVTMEGRSAVQKKATTIESFDMDGADPVQEKPVSKISSTSGFGNASASSPFASVAGSKSPSSDTATSASAFAASGFSALTGSTSGFGAIGKSTGGFGTGGSFATGSKSPILSGDSKKEAESTKSSSDTVFGGPLGQQSVFSSAAPAGGTSTFGSGASGFGKLGGSSGFGSGFGSGGGFGSLGGSGGGLTSFASGKPANFLSSSKSPKAFGAPAEEEQEEGEDAGEEGDESGIKSPLSQESDKQDERFYEQELETGEEDEKTEYSCRAKLYNFASVADGKKEWKERGLGVVRLNVKNADPEKENSGPTARLLMRAEGSHRVILNTPVKKEIKFGTPTGEPPQGGFVYFMGAVDGATGLELLQLKVRQQFATELYDKIVELQGRM